MMLSDKTVLFNPGFLPKLIRSYVIDLSPWRTGEVDCSDAETVDLTTIPLIEISSEIQELNPTTVKLPEAIHKRLKQVALKRNSTMNALLNSAIWAYETDPPFGSERRPFRKRSSRRERGRFPLFDPHLFLHQQPQDRGHDPHPKSVQRPLRCFAPDEF
jgi:hypothetical protein